MNDIPNGGYGFDTQRSKWIASLRDGEPCDHRGCLSHISHPREGCGRVGGRRTEEPNHGNNREAASTLTTGVVSSAALMTPPLCFTNETNDLGS